MAINEEINVRRNFTLDRKLYEDLQQIAVTLTASGPGKVAVSDLINEGAQIVLDKYRHLLVSSKQEFYPPSGGPFEE